MSNDPDHNDLVAIARYAGTLGLHGVMIMSPICPRCRKAHDFAMFTDLAQDELPGGLRRLLAYMASVSEVKPDEEITIEGEKTQ